MLGLNRLKTEFVSNIVDIFELHRVRKFLVSRVNYKVAGIPAT